jgi:hypothetical protein
VVDRFIKAYYFSTPLWWLLDSFCGVNVRAAGFESIPHLKLVYYGICMLCALVIWSKPIYTPFVVLGESSVNILSLILGVMGPILKMGESVSGDVAFQNPITIPYIINFCVAGSVACLGFHRSQAQIARSNQPL